MVFFWSSRKVSTRRTQSGHVFCAKKNASQNYYTMMQLAHVLWTLFYAGVLARLFGWAKKASQVALAHALSEGVCIEADPQTFTNLRRNRSCICLNACLDRTEREIAFSRDGMAGGILGTGYDHNSAGTPVEQVIHMRTKILEHVLQECGAPTQIDYLSIDIEGAEEAVLGDFNFARYTFRTITIERPSERLQNIFDQHGYLLIKKLPGLDYFYVHQSFTEQYMNNTYGFYQKRHFAMRWL